MLRHSSTRRELQSSISKKSRSSGAEEVVEPEGDSEEQRIRAATGAEGAKTEKRREGYEDVSILGASLVTGQELSLLQNIEWNNVEKRER